jgi:hypothetical protein
MGKRAERVLLGKWSEARLNRLIMEASAVPDAGSRIDCLSKQFLDTPYGESTLTGDEGTPEIFVINMASVDCFTFLDYVEAMRLSSSYGQFKKTLKRVRYKKGLVSFLTRNHFFTDWIASNRPFIEDVTHRIGGALTQSTAKILNLKSDGTLFLPGIPSQKREITYISGENIDGQALGRLRTGDYGGIYSEMPGLDASHVGIIIEKAGKFYLRHASSLTNQRKVVEEGLKGYLEGKPGLIVLRPREVALPSQRINKSTNHRFSEVP